MIERQIDVVKRVSDLVSDRRRQTAHDRGFLSFVQLRFQLVRTAELDGHFVEERGEFSHFVTSLGGWNAKRKIAGRDMTGRSRKILNRTRKAPDYDRC